MFKKVLIANRGEIAVRIIRACREMGIATVAVYSEADSEALHTHLADEAVCIGPAKSQDSYLNMERILSAAVVMGADAIHPGFGFLSENARFAELCSRCHLTFIGPSAGVIAKMGNKAEARKTMTAAGIPVVPGGCEPVRTPEEGLLQAEQTGYPVMIKAALGGGGKGMRIARTKEEFTGNFLSARMEAEKAFSDDSMYIERYLEHPRHIEFQVLADEHGNVIHLGERDCSVQKNHQKLLEESPSPALSEELRSRMGETAVRAARAAGYTNAGTVEFLLDQEQQFYFIEMNTRIQVEHPVTEMVTGLDLIREQLRIAAGEVLGRKQEDIDLSGHAVECRINAKTPGIIKKLLLPGGCGIRVDTAVYNGCSVPPYYDAMLVKLIAHGADRRQAIEKLKGALDEVVIDGIETNLESQYEILENPVYQAGEADTGFMETQFGERER
ncbi:MULTISPECIES: acetyl-CoA carboxylase biotin carboxylase subunit [unclassified Candidatus Paralachnospira]|uniref:acetyl-CoA carboxylase biotin carboxylase subunit n=1 Tax=unclassified Candidatus Paralachnospira TaxID=3099471 RepID=UPI003F8E61FE